MVEAEDNYLINPEPENIHEGVDRRVYTLT